MECWACESGSLMSGHGMWILQTNLSLVEFLGKATCISHRQKHCQHTVTISNSFHYFINYNFGCFVGLVGLLYFFFCFMIGKNM